MSKFASFFQQVMSGADNTTPSIGRYLALFLFINFLLTVPAVILVAMLLKHADWDVWEKMFTSLTLYVPAISGSAVGLIGLTSHTEPKAHSE